MLLHQPSLLAAFILVMCAQVGARTVQVSVTGSGFGPNSQKAAVGDEIAISFTVGSATFTQSSFDSPCTALSGGIDSGLKTIPPGGGPQSFTFTLKTASPLYFFNSLTSSQNSCKKGFVFTLNASTQQLAQFKTNAANSGNAQVSQNTANVQNTGNVQGSQDSGNVQVSQDSGNGQGSQNTANVQNSGNVQGSQNSGNVQVSQNSGNAQGDPNAAQPGHSEIPVSAPDGTNTQAGATQSPQSTTASDGVGTNPTESNSAHSGGPLPTTPPNSGSTSTPPAGAPIPTPAPPTANGSDSSHHSGNTAAKAAGIVFGVLAVLAVVLVGVLRWWRRRHIALLPTDIPDRPRTGGLARLVARPRPWARLDEKDVRKISPFRAEPEDVVNVHAGRLSLASVRTRDTDPAGGRQSTSSDIPSLSSDSMATARRASQTTLVAGSHRGTSSSLVVEPSDTSAKSIVVHRGRVTVNPASSAPSSSYRKLGVEISAV